MGSGYTIEGQKTSEEKYGGLQIEVTPELQSGLRLWSRKSDKHVKQSPGDMVLVKGMLVFDEKKTPADLGLRPGEMLRTYPSGRKYHIPVKVKDFMKDTNTHVWKVSSTKYRSKFSQADIGLGVLLL